MAEKFNIHEFASFQHSLRQLMGVREIFNSHGVSESEALFAVAQLVNHGFPEAPAMIEGLKSQLKKNVVLQEILTGLEMRHRNIMKIGARRLVFADRPLMERLYQTEGHVFVRHPDNRNELMVVFTTIFNNFGVSNAVITAQLIECGFSVQLLKDCTTNRYLNGVVGCGEDLAMVAKWIEKFRLEQRFDRMYVSGYSSGGYASLYLTTLIESDGYIGFSIESDYSSGGPPEIPFQKKVDLRSNVKPEFLCALRDRIASSQYSVRRAIYYDKEMDRDKAEAENLRGLPNTVFHEIPKSGHAIPETLIQRDSLAQEFEQIRAHHSPADG